MRLLASFIAAALYESPIDVRDADDVRAMGDRGELTAASVQTLVELLEDEVDLNAASREALYELPGLTWADVDAVIAARPLHGLADLSGVLTADQLHALRPFARIETTPARLAGRYRTAGAYTLGDALAPPAFLQASLRGPRGLSGAVGMTGARRLPGSPLYDTDRDALTATLPRYSLDVPKAFVRWQGERVHLIAGSFRAGFGQRLTLDNTVRNGPLGFYADDIFYVPGALSTACRVAPGELGVSPCEAQRSHYETDDFKWRETFRGLAASVSGLPLGVSAFGFASWQTRSVYQYELVDRRSCADPRLGSAACSAPAVYADTGALLEPALAFSTLPALYDELAAGGHVELALPYVTVALTGYGAVPRWHVQTLQLDFQRWSKYPFGGAFGAIGADARAGFGPWTFFAELTRSFDGEPQGGGGFAGLIRSVYSSRARELEVSTRYYDVRFVNPYARPISSPDEVDGSRARDEAGVRFKYTERAPGDLHLRSFLDVWLLPSDAKALDALVTDANPGYRAGTANLWAQLRGDWVRWRVLRPSLWLEYRDKDLGHSALGACYASSDSRAVPIVDGAPELCTGELFRIGARLELQPWGDRLDVLLTYVHDFVSDERYKDRLDQDVRVSAEARGRPWADLLLRLRVRYVHYDIFSNNYLEQSLWTFAEVSWVGLQWLHASLRYDDYLWLDRRASTLRRTPNPEHRFRLELEGRF